MKNKNKNKNNNNEKEKKTHKLHAGSSRLGDRQMMPMVRTCAAYIPDLEYHTLAAASGSMISRNYNGCCHTLGRFENNRKLVNVLYNCKWNPVAKQKGEHL